MSFCTVRRRIPWSSSPRAIPEETLRTPRRPLSADGGAESAVHISVNRARHVAFLLESASGVGILQARPCIEHHDIAALGKPARQRFGINQ